MARSMGATLDPTAPPIKPEGVIEQAALDGAGRSDGPRDPSGLDSMASPIPVRRKNLEST